MDIDKLNAFLATAVGGIIFKWLAGAVKTCYQWLHKVHPEEKFLIDDLNISAPLIRITYCRYKKNIKKHTNGSILFQKIFGALVIAVSFLLLFIFLQFIFKTPIKWIDFTHSNTKDEVWIKSDEAKNPSIKNIWRITPDLCLNKKSIERIESIKPETKSFICDYMLIPDKKEELRDLVNKNFLLMMVISPVVIFTLIFFISLGLGALVDIYIVNKITKYNDQQSVNSYQYLT